MDIKTRFMNKVMPEPNSGCWLWYGALKRGGYSTFLVDGKPTRGHRVSYELFKHKIPNGLWVLHTCDVRSCVNPDHLFLGTHDDNMADRQSKSRQCQGEENGQSKISNMGARVIRRLGAFGTIPQAAIGELFGVSVSAVWQIIHRKSWTHV